MSIINLDTAAGGKDFALAPGNLKVSLVTKTVEWLQEVSPKGINRVIGVIGSSVTAGTETAGYRYATLDNAGALPEDQAALRTDGVTGVYLVFGY